MKILQPKPFFFNKGKKAIILLHSFSGTPNDMRLIGRTFERNDYSVYAPMFAGHGTSEPLDILEKGHPDIWWQQVLDAIEFLKQEGKEEFYIFGLSLGAIFATKGLENCPEIKLGGVFGSPLYADTYANVRKAFLTYSRKVYEIHELDEIEIAQKMRLVDSKIDLMLTNINKTADTVASELPKLAKPYFIGQGTTDEMVDPDKAELVAKDVKKSELHWYEAGHVLTINHAHKQLESDLLKFLENN
ncbi:alpha/beta hydrolase [Companilactobacillus baiquanensis]|uniref:Alpha/beta hydrolase n=1 Tax=Companilactobacillus baiquanensis TaxID=2486005 RepID=A0ABW1UVS6_9LACO|nr:alpha/beta fold hydrolase [Companilactobacillus baiquanensis]